MRLIRGDKLSPQLRQKVLAAYVHRWTRENAKQTYGGKCPACAQQAMCGGSMEVDGKPWHEYHVPLTTDAKWLRVHAFHVTHADELSMRHRYCEPAILAETT